MTVRANPAAPKSPRWLSVHLGFSGALYRSHGDDTILSVIRPLLSSWTERRLIRKGFFVRYGEGGPHIRFRVLLEAGTPEAALLEELACLVAESNSRTLPSDDASAPKAIVDRTDVTPYVAEKDRYGGAVAIEIAETIFDASSRAAISLLATVVEHGEERRVGQALLAMLVTLHAFLPHPGEAAALCHVYSQQYLEYVARTESDRIAMRGRLAAQLERRRDEFASMTIEVWDRLRNEDTISATLDEYRTALQSPCRALCDALHAGAIQKDGSPILSRSAAIAVIVPSYLHMMNNRMGLTLRDEVYLSHLLASGLDAAFTTISGTGESSGQ